MEDHSCIEFFCRLCGAERVIPHRGFPVKKDSFKRDIMFSLNLDISADSETYPPYICSLCQRKLQRWRTKKNKNVTNNQINIELYREEQFADILCSTCQDKPAEVFPKWIKDCIKEKCTENNKLFHELTSHKLSFHVLFGDFYFLLVNISPDLRWSVTLNGISVNCDTWNVADVLLDIKTVNSLVEKCIQSKPCSGITGYHELCRCRVPIGSASFLDKKGCVVAYEELTPIHTIRNIKCQRLSCDTICTECALYKSTITSMWSRLNKKKEEPASSLASSHARHDYMNKEQLKRKLSNVQKDRQNLRKHCKYLEEKIEKEGVTLHEQSKSFEEIISSNPPEPNSLADLLWQQQQLYNQKENKKQMRWHPLLIRWCIAIHATSPKTYNMIRDSNILSLPHDNTLRDYTHVNKANIGLDNQMITRIKSDIGFEKLKTVEKNVLIVFDEVKIKQGLVYCTKTGRLIGFTDMGDAANEIQQFVNALEDKTPVDEPLATHILAVMVRGLLIHVNLVFAFYPCTGFTSWQLYSVIWEAIGCLETNGFHVRGLCSDGASPNRKFYRMHKPADTESQEITFFTKNRFRKGGIIYYYIHLIKTTRNNWENSGWHNKTRNLEKNGLPIRWTQLVKLVETDLGIVARKDENGGQFIEETGAVGGLRLLSRIGNDHLRLTPGSRMNVRLAAQVLSGSVAAAFKLKTGDSPHDENRSVRKFVKYMNRFFDCCNVSNKFEHTTKRNPYLAPYTDLEDKRFQWLEEKFVGFFKEWEDECLDKVNIPKEADRRRMCLSRETLEGLRITVKSVVNLTKDLLRDGMEYVLTAKYNQDPLEQYFSKQRACGGKNENPSVQQFQNNAQKLLVACSRTIRGSVRGNCTIRDEQGILQLDDTPLPRRKSKDKD